MISRRKPAHAASGIPALSRQLRLSPVAHPGGISIVQLVHFERAIDKLFTQGREPRPQVVASQWCDALNVGVIMLLAGSLCPSAGSSPDVVKLCHVPARSDFSSEKEDSLHSIPSFAATNV